MGEGEIERGKGEREREGDRERGERKGGRVGVCV